MVSSERLVTYPPCPPGLEDGNQPLPVLPPPVPGTPSAPTDRVLHVLSFGLSGAGQ